MPESQEPLLSTIDLTEDSQYAIYFFNALPDIVDGMGAGWVGKDTATIEYLMALYEIDDQQRVFELLLICIDEYRKFYGKKREAALRETKTAGKRR